MNKLYRLRHKPTGLFFASAMGACRKNNLKKVGKAYEKIPNLSYLGRNLFVGASVVKKYNISAIQEYRNYVIPVVLSDWEIVEYELIEKRIL